MFIDFLTIMLLNLVAGFTMLAIFIFKYMDNPKVMIPGFLITGLTGSITGGYMIFTWPLPGNANIAFGEPSFLFGIIFLVAAIAIAKDWDLVTVTIYAFFAGIAAVIIGIGILTMGMTKSPIISALGFITAGLAGIGAFPLYLLRKNKVIRILAALAMLGIAGLWGITTAGSYYGHLDSFKGWKPATMVSAPPAPSPEPAKDTTAK